jgi:hypothetical protein
MTSKVYYSEFSVWYEEKEEFSMRCDKEILRSRKIAGRVIREKNIA